MLQNAFAAGAPPRTPPGELTELPSAANLFILLIHVALCQRVRGVIARTRYINVLTYLLTYISRLCKFWS